MPIALALVLAAAATESVLQVPIDVGGTTFRLETSMYRPEGPGPFPLVIISHGAEGRGSVGPRWRPTEQAQWFVDRGFLVVVPMRRGNAGSEGVWAEGFGPCEAPDDARAVSETATDILGTLDFMASRPEVDPSRVVLVGHSAGGLGSIAAASRRPTEIAVVFNFAGGRGSMTSDHGAHRTTCAPTALIVAAGRLGRPGLPETFWLYAENDRSFGPTLARAMFAAFQTKAHNATFVLLARFEHDGHAIFWKPNALSWWTGPVGRALDRLLPTR